MITEKEIKKRTQNEISIIMSADNNYAFYLGVTIKSIVVHASPKRNYTIYILDGEISKKNKSILNKIQTKNVKIKYIDMLSYLKDFDCNLLYTYDYFTLPTYFRFFIPLIFKNYDKVIYCDCDAVFMSDIAELYNVEMNNYWIAAVRDTYVNILLCNNEKKLYFKNTLKLKQPENYFQAGLLIMNIQEMLKNNLTDLCLEALKEIKKPLYLDQCILNSICQNHVLFLDGCWNIESPVKRNINKYKNILPDYIFNSYIQAYENPKYMHFCGEKKPWNTPKISNSKIFWEYAVLTPFYKQILIENNISNPKTEMKNLSFFQKLFSVKNSIDKIHKIITIFGIQIKIKRYKRFNKK